jgi:hypothetical protein
MRITGEMAQRRKEEVGMNPKKKERRRRNRTGDPEMDACLIEFFLNFKLIVPRESVIRSDLNPVLPRPESAY